MLPQNNPDRIRIVFDDHRLVANAGLLLPATLARHLGLRELVDRHLDPGGAPGRATTGDKLLTLVASALAGGDCIDDADVLRTGGTVCTLGSVVKAPSTLGTFLRSFRWGHVPSTRPREPPVAGTRMAGPGDTPFCHGSGFGGQVSNRPAILSGNFRPVRVSKSLMLWYSLVNDFHGSTLLFLAAIRSLKALSHSPRCIHASARLQ